MNSNFKDEKINKDLHQYSYEIIARHVLGASPKPVAKWVYKMYNKILKY